MSGFNTLAEYYSDTKRWSDLDLRSFDIIQLMEDLNKTCLHNSKDSNHLIVLTVDSASKEPMLLHHLT